MEEVVLTGASVLMEEVARRRELGYLKARWGVAIMEREEGRRKLTEEERERRVGDVRGTEMVAAMAIAALSNAGGYSILPFPLLLLTSFHRKVPVCNQGLKY